MQTHSDSDAVLPNPFMERLQERAEYMRDRKLSEITAGKHDEPVLDEWKHGAITVTKRPDDEQAILRISIGGGLEGKGTCR